MPKQQGNTRNPRLKDMSGRKFGRLLVIRENGRTPEGRAVWLCLCDCGKETSVHGKNLRNGNTKGCGCTRGRQNRTHGSTPEWRAWSDMNRRCYKEGHPEFCRYGQRGISVCDDWINSYEQFLKDMGPRPTPGHSLDRVDNNGNYFKENCRWATVREQTRNRRGTVWVTIGESTLCIADWCRKNGISSQLANTRIHRLGWTIEKAVTTPPKSTLRPKMKR